MADAKTPEYEPPQACVNRMIKSVLPNNVQITKDSRAAFARAAGIYIFYLTSCANDFSRERKRQTIFPTDVMSALTELDMGEFVGDVEKFLEEMKSKDGPASKKARLNGDGDGDETDVNKSVDSANSGDANDDGEQQVDEENDVDDEVDADLDDAVVEDEGEDEEAEEEEEEEVA
jgi:DNA polymerase epsilon subunit 3